MNMKILNQFQMVSYRVTVEYDVVRKPKCGPKLFSDIFKIQQNADD